MPVYTDAWRQASLARTHAIPAWLGGPSVTSSAASSQYRPGAAASQLPGNGNAPGLRQHPIPPWLAAATAPAGGSASGVGGARPSPGKAGRLRITPSRVQGTVFEWNAALGVGFVKPAEPIDHPDASKSKKGLHLAAVDVLPKGTVLHKGMEVTFFVFSDGMKLGAESCMEYKGTFLNNEEKQAKTERTTGRSLLLDAIKGSSKGKAKGSGKDNWKSAGSAQKGGYWVWTKYDDDRPAKGGGKQKSEGSKGKSGASRPGLPRTRISEGYGSGGTVVEWKGTHGFIEPYEAIDHPKAAKHNGRLYIHKKDILEGSELSVGQVVNFNVFEDHIGLGAEECIAC